MGTVPHDLPGGSVDGVSANRVMFKISVSLRLVMQLGLGPKSMELRYLPADV